MLITFCAVRRSSLAITTSLQSLTKWNKWRRPITADSHTWMLCQGLQLNKISYYCENEIISMSRAWDKKIIWILDRVRTYDLPNSGRALYPLELRRTHEEQGHILGSDLTSVLHTTRISNVLLLFCKIMYFKQFPACAYKLCSNCNFQNNFMLWSN